MEGLGITICIITLILNIANMVCRWLDWEHSDTLATVTGIETILATIFLLSFKTIF